MRVVCPRNMSAIHFLSEMGDADENANVGEELVELGLLREV